MWFVFQLKKWTCKYLSTGTAFVFIHPRTRSTYFSIWMIINMFTSYQNQSCLIWACQFIFRCLVLFTTTIRYPVQHSWLWHPSLLAQSTPSWNWGGCQSAEGTRCEFWFLLHQCVCSEGLDGPLGTQAAFPSAAGKQPFVILVPSAVLVQGINEVPSQ